MAQVHASIPVMTIGSVPTILKPLEPALQIAQIAVLTIPLLAVVALDVAFGARSTVHCRSFSRTR